MRIEKFIIIIIIRLPLVVLFYLSAASRSHRVRRSQPVDLNYRLEFCHLRLEWQKLQVGKQVVVALDQICRLACVFVCTWRWPMEAPLFHFASPVRLAFSWANTLAGRATLPREIESKRPRKRDSPGHSKGRRHYFIIIVPSQPSWYSFSV